MSMPKKRVCLVVDNDVYKDSRVRKFIRTLSNRYDVVVVGVSKERMLTTQVAGNFILASGVALFLYEKVKSLYKRMRPSSELVAIIQEDTQTKSSKFFVRDWLWYFSGSLIKRKLYSVISKLDVDVYHANDLPVLAPTIKVARKNGAKVIYDSHELYMDQGMFLSDFIINRYTNEEYDGIRHSSAVITVNEFIGKELKRRYSLKEEPHVIYNYPYATAKTTRIQKENSETVILYQGLYGPSRGLEELVESMKYVDRKYQLKLRGVGDYALKLRQIVKEQKLEDRVEFLDPVKSDELTKSATFADIGVIMYKADCLNNLYASPNKLFEYINAGLAILCNNLPFVANIVETRKLGICVEKVDAKTLAEAIGRFNKERIELFKKNANLVSNVFTWENQEPKILEIYDRVLKVQ